MNIRIITIPLLLAGLTVVTTATAGRLGPFQERLVEQRQQIERGIANGRLAPREARQLRQQEREIAWARQQHLSNGRLNRAERRDLDRRLDNLDRSLRALTHNRLQRSAPSRSGQRRERHVEQRQYRPRYPYRTYRAPRRFNRHAPVFAYGPPARGMTGYGYRFRSPSTVDNHQRRDDWSW